MVAFGALETKRIFSIVGNGAGKISVASSMLEVRGDAEAGAAFGC